MVKIIFNQNILKTNTKFKTKTSTYHILTHLVCILFCYWVVLQFVCKFLKY